MVELLGPSGPCLQAAAHLFSQTSHIPGEKMDDSEGTKEAQIWKFYVKTQQSSLARNKKQQFFSPTPQTGESPVVSVVEILIIRLYILPVFTHHATSNMILL